MKDFKKYCDELLSLYEERKIKKEDITKRVCKEFGVVPKTFRVRFKSIYKNTLTEVCNTKDFPSKDIVVSYLVRSKDVKEFWGCFERKVRDGERRAFFEKFFGCSTFKRAKAKLELSLPKIVFNPTIDENKSLIVSQLLGDGSYSRERRSLRLSHGEKQIPYAIYKAQCFNKAFPSTKHYSRTSVLKHTQGHIYSSWYSGVLPTKITTWIEGASSKDLVDALTPFGIMLYILDDGYCNFNFDLGNGGNNYFTLFCNDKEVSRELKEMFKSYGVEVATRPHRDGMYLEIKDILNATKLYRNFIEPFIQEIPVCMKYKTELKI